MQFTMDLMRLYHLLVYSVSIESQVSFFYVSFLFIYVCIYLFIYVFIYLFIYLFIYSFIKSSIHSFINSLIHSFVYLISDETPPASLNQSIASSDKDEEEAWLDALEAGELDDYGEIKKQKDPATLTARQVRAI